MQNRKRIVVLQVVSQHADDLLVESSLRELQQLIETYSGETIEVVVQRKEHPHPATYIGPGKLEWLKEMVRDSEITTIVVNDIVNSAQLFRLEKALWEVNTQIAVWDRVDLILALFDQHANTTEAKLQIELARLQHMGPRFYGLGKTELSRQGGGIGTRGKGETNIEIERRNMKKRMQVIREELGRRARLHARRISKRHSLGVRTAALVGYTSAGKTTLFNALTKKTKQTHQGLFTTLDSTLGKLDPRYYPQQLLVSDTIGFIDDLPPLLIDAFRSTLQESLEADLVLHVVDVADPDWRRKYTAVETILTELGIEKAPIIVGNKIDLLKNVTVAELVSRFPGREFFAVSAQKKTGLIALRQRISALTTHQDSSESGATASCQIS